MKKSFILAFIMFIMMMFCPVFGFAQQADQPAKKIYAIYVSDFHSSSYVLGDVEASDFNGVKCLKGKQVDLTWVANRTVYIPVEKIENIVEYDSLEEYKNDIDKYNKKRLENGG